jgi:hypothetical protein
MERDARTAIWSVMTSRPSRWGSQPPAHDESASPISAVTTFPTLSEAFQPLREMPFSVSDHISSLFRVLTGFLSIRRRSNTIQLGATGELERQLVDLTYQVMIDDIIKFA